MPDNNMPVQTEDLEIVRKSAGTIIATGVLLLLMGVFAMGSPLVAGLSLAMMVGMVLLFGGIGQIFFAFQARGGASAYIFGALTILVGGYMASRPGAALGSLTIFLALYLIFSGVSELVMAFRFRPLPGWGLAAFSGTVAMLLGFMIWRQFPLSGAWAIGILIGVRLFFNGLTFLMIGLAARREQ